MIIKFKNYGSSLGTRDMGREIYLKANNEIINNGDITFDFEDIDVISRSYADEILGSLISEHGLAVVKKRSRFINVNPFVSRILLDVINTPRKQ